MTSANRLKLPLRSRRLRVRLPRSDDAPRYLEIQMSPRVLDSRPGDEPWTLSQVRRWIAQRRQDARAGTRYDLAIELRSSQRVVGRVALKGIDYRNGRAELAYWLDPECWGAGLASEAAQTLCRAGFATLRLRRIDAGVFEFNRRSIALLERMGFQREGAVREAIEYDHRWFRELRYGLLRGELKPSARARTPKEGGGRPSVQSRRAR